MLIYVQLRERLFLQGALQLLAIALLGSASGTGSYCLRIGLILEVVRLAGLLAELLEIRMSHTQIRLEELR